MIDRFSSMPTRYPGSLAIAMVRMRSSEAARSIRSWWRLKSRKPWSDRGRPNNQVHALAAVGNPVGDGGQHESAAWRSVSPFNPSHSNRPIR
jgi:hypothetical protein